MSVEVHSVELHATRHMNLADEAQVELAKQRVRVEPMIARIGVEIVQVEQQATAALATQRVEERGFVHFCARNVEVVDVVLEQERHGYAVDDRDDARNQEL